MRYGETVGLENLFGEICRYREAREKVWEPAELLERPAEEGKKFSEM